MKSMKTIWAALCAVLFMMGVVSCVPGDSSDATSTAYVSGYFDVKESGKVLKASDGTLFTLKDALTYNDGTVPERVWTYMYFTYTGSLGTDIQYSKYTFTVANALPCMKADLVKRQDFKVEETTSIVSVGSFVYDGSLLNFKYSGYVPSDTKKAAWYVLIDRIQGNVIDCSLEMKSDGTLYESSELALYVPIASFLEEVKEHAEDNKITIRFNNRDDYSFTYEYK